MAEFREHRVVVPVPRELGLTDEQGEAMRKTFESNIVDNLGGVRGLAQKGIIVVVVIIFF